MMADVTDDEVRRLHDRWKAGDRDDRAWFVILRAPMTRAAIRGIRRMTGDRASAEDVDDAVVDAFIEFQEKDPSTITEPVGLAAWIAFRRGQDAGRRRNRLREFEGAEISEETRDPLSTIPEDEVTDAAEREQLHQFARECVELLPAGQAEVVRATLLADEELSDWANAKGKSYQAAYKQRQKALDALLDCVKNKREPKEGR